MPFLKKHYEKILLSFVLLILAGTAGWLFIAIDKKRQEISVTIPPLENGPKIKPMDMSLYEKPLEQLQTPPKVDFGLPHHVFNSVVWKQMSDGRLMKVIGIDLPRIANIKPLHFTIEFESATDTGGYQFKLVREAVAKKPDQKKFYVKEGDKSTFFKLKKVEGAAEKPSKFVLELNDRQQEVVVTPDQPFERIDGYAADLKYEAEKKEFNNARTGETITFGGESYKVVAITPNEVTVQANSNQKQSTVKWKTAP